MSDSDPEIESQSGEGDSLRYAPGHCAQAEERLLEYLDGVLPTKDSSAVKAHLAACHECQALADQWRSLDLELAAGLKRPSLSPSFRTRIWQKIGAEADSTLARKRARLRAAWETDWSDHRRRFLWTQLPALLDYLGYGVMGVLAAYVLLRLSRALLSLSTQLTTNSILQWVLPLGLCAAVLSLTTAFGLAAKRPLKRWLAGF